MQVMDSKLSQTNRNTGIDNIKERIDKIANNIFINCSNFNQETKKFQMNYQQLLKLSKDSDIVSPNNLSSVEFEIIVRKVVKQKKVFTLEEFLEVLILVAEKLYPGEFKKDPKQTLHLLISEKLEFFDYNNTSNINNLSYNKHNTTTNTNMNDTNNKNLSSNNIISNVSNFHTRNKTHNTTNSELIHKVHNSSYNYNRSEMNTSRESANNFLVEEFEYFFENFILEPNHKKVINHLYEAFLKIYSFYFSAELRNQQDMDKVKQENLSSFIKFAKDFEIVPYYINLNSFNKYYIMFNEYDHTLVIPEDKNIGVFFTLSNFCLSIIHLSHFFSLKKFSNKKNNSISETDKYLLFLKHLTDSRGFDKLKLINTNNKNMTLIPSINFLMEIGSTELFPKYRYLKRLSSLNFNTNRFLNLLKEEQIMKNDEENINAIQARSNSYDSHEQGNSMIVESSNYNRILNSDLNKNNLLIKLNMNKKTSQKEKIKLGEILNVSNRVIEEIEQSYIIGLRNIFNHYCKIGDKINASNLLNSNSWLKILQDCGIVSKNNYSGIYINNQLIFKKGLIEYQNNMSSIPNNNTQNTQNNLNLESHLNRNVTQLNSNQAMLIFQDLTGKKNFPSEKKTKIINITNFDKKALIKLTKETEINKMDFNLFLKSLEIIATKAYMNIPIDVSLIRLFDEYLINNINEVLGLNDFSDRMENFSPYSHIIEDLDNLFDVRYF